MTDKDEIVFVVFDSSFDKTKVVEFEDNNDNVNVFYYKQLLFNVSKHQLVPLHQKVDDDTKRTLKKKLLIKNFGQLPLIYKSDPVCKYYNFRKGDVIKIHRPSMGNKEHIAYRFVV
jgi:DNA-directed RNA polymerase subunit H (RpoH/RPB5)